MTRIKELLTMHYKLSPLYIKVGFDTCWYVKTPIEIDIGKLFLEDECIYQHLDPVFVLLWLLNVKEYDMAKDWLDPSKGKPNVDINFHNGLLLNKITLCKDKGLFDIVVRRPDFDPSYDKYLYVKYAIALNYVDTLIYLLEQKHVTVTQDFIDLAKHKDHSHIVTILESHR